MDGNLTGAELSPSSELVMMKQDIQYLPHEGYGPDGYGPQFIAEETEVVAAGTKLDIDRIENIENGILVDIESYACSLPDASVQGPVANILQEAPSVPPQEIGALGSTGMDLVNSAQTISVTSEFVQNPMPTEPAGEPQNQPPKVSTYSVVGPSEVGANDVIVQPVNLDHVAPASKCEIVVLQGSSHPQTLPLVPPTDGSPMITVDVPKLDSRAEDPSSSLMNRLSDRLTAAALKSELKKAKDREKKRVQRKNPEYREKEREASVQRMRARRQDPVYRSVERIRDKVRRKISRQEQPEKRQVEKERDKIAKRMQRLRLIRVPMPLMGDVERLGTDLVDAGEKGAGNGHGVTMETNPLGFQVEDGNVMMEVYREMVVKSEQFNSDCVMSGCHS